VGNVWRIPRRLTDAETRPVMEAAGVTPLEPYPGAVKWWRCECQTCGRDVHRVVEQLGRNAGVENVRPHGLRHSAVLDATNGDVREARAFSRHAKLETVALYEDARTDVEGELSTRLGELIGHF
jgi:hypothetical protein